MTFCQGRFRSEFLYAARTHSAWTTVRLNWNLRGTGNTHPLQTRAQRLLAENMQPPVDGLDGLLGMCAGHADDNNSLQGRLMLQHLVIVEIGAEMAAELVLRGVQLCLHGRADGHQMRSGGEGCEVPCVSHAYTQHYVQHYATHVTHVPAVEAGSDSHPSVLGRRRLLEAFPWTSLSTGLVRAWDNDLLLQGRKGECSRGMAMEEARIMTIAC